MSSKKINKKSLFIGLSLFSGIGIVTAAIAVPLALQKNDKPGETVNDGQFLVTTTASNVNATTVNIKVNGLEKHANQWLSVEYHPQIINLVSNKEEKQAANATLLNRTFLVNDKTATVTLGGLVAGQTYNYLIKDTKGAKLSVKRTFTTFEKPEIVSETSKDGINFTTYIAVNGKDLTDNVVVRYRIFDTEGKAIWKETPAKVEERWINGQKFYVVTGTIAGLNESTPYELSFEEKNQPGSTITDPIIIWTAGNQPKVIVTENTAGEVNLEISGFDDYIANPSASTTYAVKVTKMVGDELVTTYQTIDFNQARVLSESLTNLDPNTKYTIQLVKIENGQETNVGNALNFVSASQVAIKNVTTNGITTDWRKSSTTGLLLLTGLANQNPQKAFDHSDLVAVAVELNNLGAAPNFGANPRILANVEAAKLQKLDEHDVKFSNLVAGKAYAIQVFKKTDPNFANPLLLTTFITPPMPSKMSASVNEVVAVGATIEITNLNNYQSGELRLRYWKKNSPNEVKDTPIAFNWGQSTVLVELENLTMGFDYEFGIFPIYETLTNPVDNLLRINGSFRTPAVLSAISVKGGILDEHLTFKLAGFTTDFPFVQNLALQWRIKPNNSETVVPWMAPSVNDSHNFSISAMPTNSQHLISVPNSNLANTWYTETAYEWRVVQLSNPSQNLIKAGRAEFHLNDDKLVKSFNNKIPSSEYTSLSWREPLYNNIVGSGLGNAAGQMIWRPFFGLPTKQDWQHFLEWLAFQNETIQNQVIAQISLAFEVYMGPARTNTGGVTASNMTARNLAIPYAPGGVNGTVQDFQNLATTNEPKFGGFSADQFANDAPVKPADFLTLGTNNFSSMANFSKAIKYTLNGIKDGWNNRVTPLGISKNNIFLKSLAPSIATTFASHVDNKTKLAQLFTIIPNASADGWSFETLDNSADATNIWANDLTGELYFKMKATKAGKFHYYWSKISGFQTTTGAANDQAGLSFKLYQDHSKSARLIADELSKVTDNVGKKALIEKYYQVQVGSTFNGGWNFISATLSSDGETLLLKVEVPSQKIALGTFENPTASSTISTPTQIEYSLNGYNLTALKADHIIWWQKGTRSAAQTGAEIARYANINWTYEQMLNRMKHAVLEGDVAVKALANQLVREMLINDDWANNTKDGVETIATNQKYYFRTIGKTPIGNWGDRTGNDNEDAKIKDEDKNGFVTPNALGTSNNVTRAQRIEEMINKYGEKPTSVVPEPANP